MVSISKRNGLRVLSPFLGFTLSTGSVPTFLAAVFW
jgi:hypothetical protein